MLVDELLLRSSGHTMVEKLEMAGMIVPDQEVADAPWEVDVATSRAESGGVTILDAARPKDYGGYENERNKKWAHLYKAMLEVAYGEDASGVIIAHHLCFEHGDDITTVNEIPSADTLIFDHEIMGRIFGGDAQKHMMLLASIECDKRDGVLEVIFRAR